MPSSDSTQANGQGIVLNLYFALPEYRHRGIGSLVMKWGVKKADELGIDGFLEASELASWAINFMPNLVSLRSIGWSLT